MFFEPQFPLEFLMLGCEKKDSGFGSRLLVAKCFWQKSRRLPTIYLFYSSFAVFSIFEEGFFYQFPILFYVLFHWLHRNSAIVRIISFYTLHFLFQNGNIEYSLNTSKWWKLILNVFNFFYYFFAIFLLRNSKKKKLFFKKDISGQKCIT